MLGLSDRQVKILRAVIEEYIETAAPVGSETLDKKYNLGVSPATIRNEMVKLTAMGLLKQLHTSAGRIPSSTAFKLYVNQLMEEQRLSVADEVAVKEKIWDHRQQVNKLLKEATRALAEKTGALAVATTDKGEVFNSGYANILSAPEFFDIDVTRAVLDFIDDIDQLKKVFEKAFGEEPIHVLFGDELGIQFFEPCGVVFTHIDAGDVLQGNLGVVGPCRLNFSLVIPTVRYVGNLVETILKG